MGVLKCSRSEGGCVNLVLERMQTGGSKITKNCRRHLTMAPERDAPE